MKTKWWPYFRTLRAEFLLVFLLIGILPYLILGLFMINRGSQLLQVHAKRELTTAANSYANELDRLLAHYLQIARVIASSPAIKSMDMERQGATLREMKQHLDYAQIAVADLNGQLLVASQDMPLVSVAHVFSYQEAAKGRQSWVIAPALFSDDLMLHIHTPIFGEDQKLLGVLGSPVTLPRLADELQQMGVSSGGVAFILGADKQVFVHPDPDKMKLRRNYSQWLPDVTKPGVATFTVDGVKQVAGYAPVNEAGWIVVVCRAEAEVFAPIVAARNWTFAGLLATLVVSTLLAIALARGLTRPVSELASAAAALGAGQANPPFPPSGLHTQEIQTLLDSFVTMHKAVGERENRLRSSEARNRAMIDAMPDILLRFDHQGQVLDVQGSTNVFSWGADDGLVGQTLAQLMTHSTYRQLFRSLADGVALAKQINHIQMLECQETLHGQIMDLEIRTIASGSDEVFAIVRNVTERNQAERTARRHLSALAASMDGMAILHTNLCAYANQALAQLHNYSNSQQLIGQPWAMLYTPDEHRRLVAEILPIVHRMGVWRGEAKGRRQDGAIFPQEISLTLIDTEEIVLVARDLTERKQAELMLQQAQKRESLGVLAGGIAHDFNNLLTGMIGQISLAQSEMAESEPAYGRIQKALASAGSAADLTRQLLAYAGKGRFYVEVFNMNELLRENIGLLETALPRNVTLELELEPGLPLIKADKSQIQQVVMNLVINAAEAMLEKRGSVRIKTFVNQQLRTAQAECNGAARHSSLTFGNLAPGAYICLEVSDHGVGMDQPTLSRIFDPFFTTKPHGSGLGLSATLGIIQEHRGGIHVISTLGGGSTFCVLLPATADLQPIKLPVAPAHRSISGHILVVDDETVVRELCKDVLERAGGHVLTAADGREGIDIFVENRDEVDLVILDMLMPVLNGVDALPEFKRIKPNLKIILSSGYTETEMSSDLVDAQTVVFLQKPYAPGKLVDTVANVLQA
jgi:PAS domain S-box-containing protein